MFGAKSPLAEEGVYYMLKQDFTQPKKLGIRSQEKKNRGKTVESAWVMLLEVGACLWRLLSGVGGGPIPFQ